MIFIYVSHYGRYSTGRFYSGSSTSWGVTLRVKVDVTLRVKVMDFFLFFLHLSLYSHILYYITIYYTLSCILFVFDNDGKCRSKV